MRLLLHGNDDWKISLQDKRDCSQCLMRLQIQQGKILKALSTADKGRAQALVDLMKSKYGVSLIVFSPLSHISSTTLFLAKDDESVNIWLLRNGQQCQFLQMETSDDLSSLIYGAYKQIGVNKRVWCKIRRSLKVENALKTLYDLIIAPFSHLIKRSEELTIVPNGSLFLIPFAALVDHHSKFMSEKLRIRLAPSLSCLRLLTECPEGYHSTSGALLVGDPWVESVSVKGCLPFRKLPGAEEEVKMIGQLLNTEPLTEKNAKKEEVLSRLNSVSLVHIAAHGRTETGEIILSPNFVHAKRPKEKDFLLTMGDVLNAPLRAKLVVLSCCNSGRGKIKVEGVVGMARAFLGAGAPHVRKSKTVLNSGYPRCGFWISGTGFWVPCCGFWISGTEFWIPCCGFRMSGTGFWILDSMLWIPDFRNWILDSKLWILDSMLWILDFRDWIPDYRSWISDSISVKLGFDPHSTRGISDP